MASVKTNGATPVVQKHGKVILTLENVLLPAEKLEPTPSKVDGLDADSEFDLRVMGCELIQTSGMLLRLPQVAMACGQVLFQRFYYAKSLVRYPMEATAMACIGLASKIEEDPRKIRDVINVFKHIRQLRSGRTITPVLLDGNYIALKSQVIKAERRLLKELGFCCHVKHPHKMIIIYLKLVECHENRKMAQLSWNYMNDAMRTDALVRFSPESIACACIWLAARKLAVPLPESPAWYEVAGVDLEDIHRVAALVEKLYTREKVKLETLEAKVEEIRKEQQEARIKKMQQSQTPVLATSAAFSPAATKDKDVYIKRPSTEDSDDDSPSRKRRRSVSPRRSPPRPRGRRSRKSPSDSPRVTPPPRFSKNKDKAVVRSLSRSRSRSPARTYDSYSRAERGAPRSSKPSNASRGGRDDRYGGSGRTSADKYDSGSRDDESDSRHHKYSNGDSKKYSSSKSSSSSSKRYADNGYEGREERQDRRKYEEAKHDRDGYDKHAKADKYDKGERYEKSSSKKSKKSHRSRSHDRRR